MALYRNIAGAEALGIVNDYYFVRDIDDGGGSYGGSATQEITQVQPVRSFDPVEMVFYDPWYVPQVPPTVAPEQVVEPPPPDYIAVTPTGATVDPGTITLASGETMRPNVPIVPSTTEVPKLDLSQRIDQRRIQRLLMPSIPEVSTDNLKSNLWPLAVLAGVLLVAVKGEDLLKEKRHVAFVGGIAALYYLMNKPNTDTPD